MTLLRTVEPPKAAETVNLLGELMQEAMSLGALRLYQHTDLYDQPRSDFDVTIIVLSGRSKIEAKGRQSNLCAALSDAIREAKRLAP